MSISSLLEVKKNISESAKPGYLKKINTRFVDFVLCSPDFLTPVCAINIEKRDTVRAENAKQDMFLNHAFKEAVLPLIHFKASYPYNQSEVAAHLAEVIEIKGQ